MKALGTPMKIAALEFCNVSCKWRRWLNVEQAAWMCDQGRDGRTLKWFHGHRGSF